MWKFLKIDSKNELGTTITWMMVICFCCLAISGIQNAMLCFKLGKDDTDNFIWLILPQIVTLVVMAVCSILILCMLRNVKRKKVFTNENSLLILFIGIAVECNGIFQWLLATLVSDNDIMQTYMIYILLGVFILLIGYVFKIGVQLKEEQELTI